MNALPSTDMSADMFLADDNDTTFHESMKQSLNPFLRKGKRHLDCTDEKTRAVDGRSAAIGIARCIAFRLPRPSSVDSARSAGPCMFS